MDKYIIRKIIVLILFSILFVFSFAKERTQILYLNSYSSDFPTYPDQLRGLKENFDEKNFNIQTEFLDSKRHPSGEIHKIIEETLVKKLRKKFNYDAVVTSDDNALHFVEKYYEEFFSKTPLVFFGVNNEEFANTMSLKPNITGLVEDISISANLELVDKLYPNKKLQIISDGSKTGRTLLKRVLADIEQNNYSFDVELIDLTQLSWDDLVEKLKSTENEPLLLLAAYKDKNDNMMIFQESLSLVINNYNGAIFHFWIYGVDQGMLGGNIVDHYEYGKQSSNLVKQIIDGKDIKSIKTEKGKTLYLVNYQVMKKLNLRKGEFPESTKYINQPENLFVKYKYYIITILIFFAITYTIVGFLAFQIRLRVKFEKQLIKSKKKLKKSRDELRKIIDAIPVHIYIKDKDSKILMLNKTSAASFGATPREIEGKKHSDLVPNSEDLEHILEQDRKVITGNVSKLERKDDSITIHGKHEYFDTIKIPFVTMDGTPAVLGVSINITDKTLMQNELERKNSELLERKLEVIDTQKEIIEKLGNIIEHRSKETANHIKRVAKFSRIIAEKLDLELEEIEVIETASPMHDVGKIAISEEILHKPGKLTSDEFNIIKTHSYTGYKLLEGSRREILQAAAVIAYEHHERWDGTGYPQKKTKDEIHLYARIISIADVFDALISERSYKKAWPVEEAFNYLKEERAKMFDPHLVELFLDSKEQIMQIIKEYS